MSRVLVLGGDLSVFAAALDLAEVGVEVWIADATVRVPQYSVRDTGGQVSGLLRELAAPLTAAVPDNPGAAPDQFTPRDTQLRARSGSWRPVPESAVWGVPTFPLAKACIDLVGMRAAFRGYLDRLKPVLTIGKEQNFGKLIETRLGSAMRETMVEPLLFEGFGVPAHEAEVALVEPGLNEALTRAGSLSGGALLQYPEHVARETAVEPARGWIALGELLVGRLELYGAVRFAGEVRSLELAGAGADGAHTASPSWRVTDEHGTTHEFDAVLGEHAAVAAVTAAAHVAGAAAAGAADRATLSEQLAQLAPTRLRQYAEIGIQGEVGTAGGSGTTDLLAMVAAPVSGPWAVRLTRVAADTGSDTGGDTESGRLLFSGPVVNAPGQHAEHLASPPVAEALEQFGVSAAGDTSSSATSTIRAAAFATSAQRSAQQEARDAWVAEYPSLLVLGEALHGGNLGEAIEDARQWAVRLRRKLTGISE